VMRMELLSMARMMIRRCPVHQIARVVPVLEVQLSVEPRLRAKQVVVAEW
jgi:hypothetical protein